MAACQPALFVLHVLHVCRICALCVGAACEHAFSHSAKAGVPTLCVVCRGQSDVLSEDMSEATPHHAGELAQAGSGSFSNLQVGYDSQPRVYYIAACTHVEQYCRIHGTSAMNKVQLGVHKGMGQGHG
jgi:hypothetical protein